MNALNRIAVDTSKLNAAMAMFPRDRTMMINGREAKGSGEMAEAARHYMSKEVESVKAMTASRNSRRSDRRQVSHPVSGIATIS